MVTTRRGGKRPGAGKRPTLSEIDRLAIGAEAEKRIAEAAEARLRALVETKLEPYGLREKWARLRDVPTQERKRWARRSADDGSVTGDTVFDVRADLVALARTGKIIVSHAQLRRGLRREVIATVAKEWSQRLSLTVTPRFVERCLEEYRAIISRMPL